MPYLVPSGWTTRNLREKAEPATEWHPRLNPSENLTKEVLVPSDWTTKNIRVKAEPVASALLVLRLAFSCSTRGKRAYVLSTLRTPLAHANATARACNQERGLACRALDSAQGKPCSCLSRARLCTRQALFHGSARLGIHHGRNIIIPDDNRRSGSDNTAKPYRQH